MGRRQPEQLICHGFDCQADNSPSQLLEYINQIDDDDELPWKRRVTERKADKACKRGRLHQTV